MNIGEGTVNNTTFQTLLLLGVNSEMFLPNPIVRYGLPRSYSFFVKLEKVRWVWRAGMYLHHGHILHFSVKKMFGV